VPRYGKETSAARWQPTAQRRNESSSRLKIDLIVFKFSTEILLQSSNIPVSGGSEPSRICVLRVHTGFQGNKSFVINFSLKQDAVLLYDFLTRKASKWREVVLIWKSWAWKLEQHVVRRTWLQSSIKPRYSWNHYNYVSDSGIPGCLEITDYIVL
jgi:hypothetical protein